MISTLLTAALSLSSLSHAFSIPKAKRGDGTLRVPVAAKAFDVLDVLSSLHSRQTVTTVKNIQTGTRYMVEFQIGTPPQAISIALDTGSSETWVNPACANSGSQSQVTLCNTFPRYTAASSTSAVDQGAGTVLNYGKGSANVEYYTDDFTVGGASVKAQKFGVATTSTSIPTGLMGVGPGHELTGYNTIVDELALQGVTQSRAFSLDLRSVESTDGAIIFGGLDTMKYKGNLEKLPIIPAAESPDNFNRYWVYMKSIGITKPGEASKTYTSAITNPKGQAVFLDSGGTLSRLPTPIFNAILADFPAATQDGSSGLYLVDCALSKQAGSIDFGFGNTVINVPYNEFIWHIQEFCYLGIAADDNTPVLGDTFLRSAYVVYDQDNQNIHVANAANCGSNVVAIGKGVDAVPNIAGGCGPATSTSSSSSSSSAAPTSFTMSSMSSSSTSSSSIELPTSSSSISTYLSSATLPSSTYSSFPTSASSYVSAVTDIPDYTTTIPSVSAPYPTETSLPVVSTPYPTAAYPTSTNAGYLNSTSTTKYTTSTVCSTSTYVNKAGETTTETISLYTTVCPVTEAEATPTYTAKGTPYETPAVTPYETPIVTPYETAYPSGYTISTVYATTTYTVTTCAPTVTNCPVGHVKTDTVSLYTTLCPIEAASHYPTPVDTYSTTTTYTTIKSTITLAAPAKVYTSFTAKPMSSVYKVVAPANSTVVVYPVVSSTGTAAGYPTTTSKPVQFTGAAAAQGAGNMVMVGLAFVGALFMM